MHLALLVSDSFQFYIPQRSVGWTCSRWVIALTAQPQNSICAEQTAAEFRYFGWDTQIIQLSLRFMRVPIVLHICDSISMFQISKESVLFQETSSLTMLHKPHVLLQKYSCLSEMWCLRNCWWSYLMQLLNSSTKKMYIYAKYRAKSLLSACYSG